MTRRNENKDKNDIFAENPAIQGAWRETFSVPLGRGNLGRIVTFLSSDCNIPLFKSGLVGNESLGVQLFFLAVAR